MNPLFKYIHYKIYIRSLFIVITDYTKHWKNLNLINNIYIFKDDGRCLFTRTYGSTEFDEQLIAGFLSAITHFGSELGTTTLERIDFGDYRIIMARSEYDLITAGVVDKDDDVDMAGNALKAILDDFKSNYEDILHKWKGEDIFGDYEKFADEIIKHVSNEVKIEEITEEETIPVVREQLTTPEAALVEPIEIELIEIPKHWNRVVKKATKKWNKGEATEAITKLKELLNHKKWEIRGHAADAIGNIGEKSPESVAPVLPALKQAVRDKDKDVRRFSVKAIGLIGERSPELIQDMIPDVTTALKDPYPLVRENAAVAFRKIGAISPDIIKNSMSDLLYALRDRDDAVRRNAAVVIGSSIIGIEPNDLRYVVPDIVYALSDENIEVRKYAAWIIGNICWKSPDLLKEFMIDLQHSLRDKDPDVRKYINWAIQKIEQQT